MYSREQIEISQVEKEFRRKIVTTELYGIQQFYFPSFIYLPINFFLFMKDWLFLFRYHYVIICVCLHALNNWVDGIQQKKKSLNNKL